ncbi:MAG: TolC family protein [Candidatus Manganitrophaceae bacterium]|nr:MAG: TolC family protein [Candidatus Manganitrophaceae bacterium]
MRLSKQVAGIVSERVRVGKVSPIEETRANVTLSAAQIELDRVQRQLGATRNRLAAGWGSTRPQFEKVEGDLASVSPIPTLEHLAQRLSQNPDLARWAVEISQRQAMIALEKSQAIPDLFISGGVRRFTDTNDNAFVVGVTIPLPIFNRNQGRIMEAEHRLRRAEEERRAAEVRVTTALAESYRALSTSHAEVRALEANVLPGAESAFEVVNEGYRLGKFGLLDVLDAQRTLFGARAQYLSALRGYHQAVAEVEGLVGEPLNVVQNRSEQNNRSDK